MIATQTACATPSEPGIPGFAIFADYDDGRRDDNEPFTVTDPLPLESERWS